MQALAFPFDLHVLSTPPAFVLSQDQTLHKKGREKPKPRQKRQTTTNNTTNAASPELAIQKLHKENKLQPTPNPTGHKKGDWPSQKKIINTPKQLKMFTMTPLEKAPSGIHQPQHTYNASRPTMITINQHKKVHWHTIEFSHIITTQPYGPPNDETQYCE